MPTLNSYFKRYHNKADNVDFVGITAEPLSTVRRVRSRSARMFNQLIFSCTRSPTGTSFSVRNVHRMNFPCASDPTGRVAKAYNVSSTPKAYVILDNEVQWSGIADHLELA